MRPQTPAIAAAVLLTLTLTACGGSSSGATTAAVSPSAAPAAATTPSPAATDPGCGSTPVSDAVHDSHITQVMVIGGCSMVAIETDYTRADYARAAKICDAAAKVAYVGNVSSVSVDGADHHELAIGEKGQDGCIGEP